METVQTVLLLVIVILTILLTVLGIQVFLILREIRKTAEKTNRVLDNAVIIAESISTPISTLSSLVMSIKTGVSFVNWLKKFYVLLLQHNPIKKEKESSGGAIIPAREENGSNEASDEKKASESDPNSAGNGSGSTRPSVRRFFRGIGKKIKI